MLYLHRPDLDWRGALPDLRAQFERIRVFADTSKVGQTMSSLVSKGKVIACWRIRLQGVQVYKHTLAILRRSDTKPVDKTSVLLVLDGRVIHEIGEARHLSSNVWHSWKTSDGEGRNALFTEYRITQEMYTSKLRLEVNGKTFGAATKPKQLNQKVLLALPSGIQLVLQGQGVGASNLSAKRNNPPQSPSRPILI